jgi:hypothetical protein
MMALCWTGASAVAQDYDDRTETLGESQESQDTPTEPNALPALATAARLTIEGLVLQRDDATSRPLTKAGSSSAPYAQVDSGDLDFGAAAGFRMMLETQILGQPVEFSGFYLSPIQDRMMIGGFNSGSLDTDAIYTNRDFPGGSDFFRYSEDIYGMVVEQQTDLMGAEANLRDAFGAKGLLLGGRVLNLSEKFSTSTHDREADFPPQTGTRIDGLSIRSDNILAGIQVGLQGMFDVAPGISIGGSAKAGLFANFVDVESTFTSISPSGSVPSRSRVLKSGDDVVASTVFEVNPRLDFRIADGVVLTASGTFMWINNVSDAVDYYADAANATPYTISSAGDAFIYGGGLGLRFELDGGASSRSDPTFSDDFQDVPYIGASPEELDERIALLEQSLVRTEGKPVSLSIFGQVNKMLMWWNDGEMEDVYVVDNTTSGTRIGFVGEGRISRSLKAGFNNEYRFNGNRSIRVSQIDPSGTEDQPIEVRYQELWLKHNLLGQVTWGHAGTATDDTISANLGGTSGVASSDIAFIGGAMRIRRRDRPYEEIIGTDSTIGTTLRGFARDLETPRKDGIRWDSDRYRGFMVSAFWGGDDFWDVSMAFARSWTDWRVRFRAGYLQDTDSEGEAAKTLISEIKSSAAVLHNPTGLFLNAALVHREFEGDSSRVSSQQFTRGSVTVPGENFADLDYAYFQGGIRRQWSSLGETSVFGEYAFAKDGLTGRGSGSGGTTAGFDRVTDSSLTMVGGGIVQDIDAADMELYAGFRYFIYDVKGVEGGGSTTGAIPPDAEAFEDLGIVYSGTRIKF